MGFVVQMCLKKLKSIETIKNESLRKGFKVKQTGSRINFFNNNSFIGVIVSSMYPLFDKYIDVEKIKESSLDINSIERNYDYFCYKDDKFKHKWYFRNEWFEFEDILPDNLFEI